MIGQDVTVQQSEVVLFVSPGLQAWDQGALLLLSSGLQAFDKEQRPEGLKFR
jgi:hypothetical protein